MEEMCVVTQVEICHTSTVACVCLPHLFVCNTSGFVGFSQNDCIPIT